jgi:hypothetical protein
VTPKPDAYVRVSPDLAAELVAAMYDEGRALTEDEIRRMVDDDEWPEWCDSPD